MIREVIEFFLTPSSSEARKNGYLYEAVAFQSRGKRNQKNWLPHWTTCQNVVQDFCQKYPGAKSLTIFGSGCLFEVPKSWLVDRFEKIVLVDQVFPREVRNWVKSQKQGQIEMHEFDLSKKFSAVEYHLKTDLHLSANLLSQLPLRPLVKEMKIRKLSDEQQNVRRLEIESQHLSFLKSLGAPILLWTDTDRVYVECETQQILDSEKTVLSQLPLAIKSWDWRLAPAPEWDKRLDVVLKMQAVIL